MKKLLIEKSTGLAVSLPAYNIWLNDAETGFLRQDEVGAPIGAIIGASDDTHEIIEVEEIPSDYESQKYIYKDSKFTIVDDWESSEDAIAKIKYTADRADNFPDLGEQLDMLFHDMTSGKGDKTGEWYKAVAKVKSDNPKPKE